jgi:3-phosphoshikimate 1-carboxyvinyltransferase
MAQSSTTYRALTPIPHPISGIVRLPGSKSITNRALPIAALAQGVSTINGALFSDDTTYMAQALRDLGFRVEEDLPRERFTVYGQGGRISRAQANLFLGNSGTAMRFLAALTALGHGRYRLDGVERMRQRPAAPLLTALTNLGVNAISEAGTGCPPLVIEANGCPGGSTHMSGDQSSQYFSALLLAAPAMTHGLTLSVDGHLVSRPYVDITIRMMEQFGIYVEREGYQSFTVPPGQHYIAQAYTVEPDASNATYFLAIAALTGGTIRVTDLGVHSLQGDIHFLDTLAALGCTVTYADTYLEVTGPAQLHGALLDRSDMNDTAQTVAALAPFCSTPVTIRGLAHTRLQETDRVRAVAIELRKLGAHIEEYDDGWTIWPSQLHGADIATYDDHRMAMAFSLIGLRIPNVRILDPQCVTKTFPDYFERLDALIAASHTCG